MVVMEIGSKSGMLTLIQPLGEIINKRRQGLFLCDCGNSKKLPVGRVNSGYVVSCGCLVGKRSVHGMRGTKTYSSWGAAKKRCLCENDKDYPRYGGVGVTFHKPWADSFELFFKDMGERPEGTTLDRIDSTKGYYPGNCKWSTSAEQAQNTKSSYVWLIHGERYESAAVAAAHYGVTVQTVNRWVKGYLDKRRPKTGKREAIDGCYRVRRYDSRQ